MITEEELEQLGEARRYRGLPSVADLEKRESARRRSRRIAQAGISGLVVAAVAVTAFTVGPFGGSQRRAIPIGPAGHTETSPPDSKLACEGFGYQRAYADYPGLLYLPPTSKAGPISGSVLVRVDVSTCPRNDATVIRYALHKNVVTARMEVVGPNARDEYAAGGFQGVKSGADIGGVTARVYWYDDALPVAYVFWTARDGSSWAVTYNGPSVADALKAIRAVTAAGGRLDPAAVPPGLDRVITPPNTVAAVPAHDDPEVHTTLTGNHGVRRLRMNTSYRGWQGQAWYGSRLEHVSGLPAWWQPQKMVLDWVTARGVAIQIQSGDPLSAARAVADAVVPVKPDDPRLVAATEPLGPTSGLNPSAPPPTP